MSIFSSRASSFANETPPYCQNALRQESLQNFASSGRRRGGIGNNAPQYLQRFLLGWLMLDILPEYTRLRRRAQLRLRSGMETI